MPLRGADKAVKRIRALGGAGGRGNGLDDVVGAVLYEGADLIRSEAFRSISAGSVSGKHHVPSRPGEPPMRDTGNLQAHLLIERTGPLEAQVRSEAKYAAALEFGSSKMAARPYLRPARDKMLKEIEKLFAQRVKSWVDAQK